MADFVKKTWSCGDTITADDLNRMEDGIEEAVECCGGGTALVVANFTKTSDTTFTSDKTFAELNEARQNGNIVMAVIHNPNLPEYTNYTFLGDYEGDSESLGWEHDGYMYWLDANGGTIQSLE